jgi:hypothetical protein
MSAITTVHTDDAPKAIGPYTQGKVVTSNSQLIFVSGILGINN